MNTQEITQLLKDFLREVEDVTPPVVMKQLLSSKADELADKITTFGFAVFNESQNQKAKIASLELKIKSQKEDINFLQEKNREAVERIGEVSNFSKPSINTCLNEIRKAIKNKGFEVIDFDSLGGRMFNGIVLKSDFTDEETYFDSISELANFLNS